VVPPVQDDLEVASWMNELAWIMWIVVLVVIVLVVVLKVLPLRHVTVYEYQKGLLYKKGRYKATLNAGSYWISSTFSLIVPVDIRPQFITIQGQDVLSMDGVTLKVSLAAEFEVVDANVAVNKNASFQASLYLVLQMAVREIVGGQKIDTLLEERTTIGAKLMERASGKAGELGVKLISADIKDIMFPGEMKKVFAQVVKAQKEGQAALERARGETAALRNLANAARTMEDNPQLLQLRALQALADSSGSTLVLGLPGNAVPVVKARSTGTKAPTKQDEGE
jgi:regulator of protease activity HflC (stomatin/prohibitin superfamily)